MNEIKWIGVLIQLVTWCYIFVLIKTGQIISDFVMYTFFAGLAICIGTSLFECRNKTLKNNNSGHGEERIVHKSSMIKMKNYNG